VGVITAMFSILKDGSVGDVEIITSVAAASAPDMAPDPVPNSINLTLSRPLISSSASSTRSSVSGRGMKTSFSILKVRDRNSTSPRMYCRGIRLALFLRSPRYSSRIGSPSVSANLR